MQDSAIYKRANYNNLVQVSWSGAMTDYFTALNGVKQGAVLTPILYCAYVDDLLLILSKAGVGCFMGLHWAHLHTRMTSFFWHNPQMSGCLT